MEVLSGRSSQPEQALGHGALHPQGQSNGAVAVFVGYFAALRYHRPAQTNDVLTLDARLNGSRGFYHLRNGSMWPNVGHLYSLSRSCVGHCHLHLGQRIQTVIAKGETS